MPRASAAGAVGRGVGCCPRSRRADSSGRAVARADLLGAAPAVVRRRGERTAGRAVPARRRVGLSDSAPAADARGCVVGRALCCWARRRLLSEVESSRVGRRHRRLLPEVKPIGQCVELFPALARRRAVGRGIGLLPEVDRIGRCGAVGRGAGHWRARLRVGSRAPSPWVRRRLLSDAEAIGQQVGRGVGLLHAVEPCWPASPWRARLLLRSSRSDNSAPAADASLRVGSGTPSCWARRRLLPEVEASGQQVGRAELSGRLFRCRGDLRCEAAMRGGAELLDCCARAGPSCWTARELSCGENFLK